MAFEDLTIVGISASSREEAHVLADDIDELSERGRVAVRELAVAHTNRHGRIKVHYITDHGAGIGAAVGAALGAVGLGSLAVAGTVATGGLLPVLVGSAVGLGVTTGAGAAIGRAFDRHHEEAKDVLESLGEEVRNGRAVTFAVVDPPNADALEESFPGRQLYRTTITAEQQEKIAEELADDA